MSQTVEIVIDGVVKNAEIGLKISDVLRADMPCGGKGRCGKCKVLATGELSPVCESERQHLTQDELEMGYRLACKCEILGKCQNKILCQRRLVFGVFYDIMSITKYGGILS